jgi:hypothetical protein
VDGQYVTQHCKPVSRTEPSNGTVTSAVKKVTSYSAQK